MRRTASRARIAGRIRGGSRLDGLPEEEIRMALASASGVQHQIIDAAKLAGLPVQASNRDSAAQHIGRRL